MIIITKTSDQTRQTEHSFSTCTILTQALGTLCSPPLLPCYSLEYLVCQLLDQPFIFYMFPSFHSSLPRFPHGVYRSCAVSCASSPLFRPPRSYPRVRFRYHPCPRSHLHHYSRFRLRSRPHSHPVFVHGPPPSSPFLFPPRPRSRLRSRAPRIAPSFSHDLSFRALGYPRVAFLAPVASIILSGRAVSENRAFEAVVCSGRVVSLMIARSLEYLKSLN